MDGLFISLNLTSEVLHRCAQRLACEVTPRSVKMTASTITVTLNTGYMRGHTVHLGKINFSVKEVKDLNRPNVVTPTTSPGNKLWIPILDSPLTTPVSPMPSLWSGDSKRPAVDTVLGGLSGRKILSRLPSAQRYHNESCYHNSFSDLGKGCLSVPHCPGQLQKNFTLYSSLPISMIISPLSFSISQMRCRSPVQFSSSSLMCIPPSCAVWAHREARSGGGLFSPPHFSIPMCLSWSVLQGHRAANSVTQREEQMVHV